MTQKKSTPKKAPKPVQRVERVERVASKKRARSPSSSEEEESDGRKRVERVASKKRTRSPSSSEEEEKRNKKRRKTTKISLIPHEKLRRRNERRLFKGRFSFRSVDFFTNILLIKIMIANPNRLRILRKEQKNKNRFW